MHPKKAAKWHAGWVDCHCESIAIHQRVMEQHKDDGSNIRIVGMFAGVGSGA